jgi:transposase
MPLSMKRRWEIVFLKKHRLGPKLEISDIAKEVRCARQTVRTWLDRYEKTGDVQDLEGRGRNRITTEREDMMIGNLMEKDSERSAADVSSMMQAKGVTISPPSVRRRLHEQGWNYRRPLTKPLLKEDHRRRRILWAKQMKDQDWEKVIFTDESTFQLYSNPRKKWTHHRLGIQFRSVKYPPKVHVYGCFSSAGFGKLICFTENLNAARLITLYKKSLLPSAETFFGPGNQDWILQEDNDPKHTSKMAAKWRRENGINRMVWPAQSPDLNPIENVWAVMKLNVRKEKPTTVKALVRAIRREWEGLSEEYAQALISSMSRRVKGVIEANGDHLMY